MFSALIQRWQGIGLPASAPAIGRRCWRLAPATLFRRLPALGCVLYLPMCPRSSLLAEPPAGLLVDDMRLAPLLQMQWLVASSVITVDGPREWIDGLDGDGFVCARLYLLPDTDYLAWDAVLGSGEPAPLPQYALRGLRSVDAQLLCFGLRRLAGLDVLGAAPAPRISALSRDLAARVAGAEAIPLRLTVAR